MHEFWLYALLCISLKRLRSACKTVLRCSYVLAGIIAGTRQLTTAD